MYTRHSGQIACPADLHFLLYQNKLIRHTGVFQVSLSNVHHWLERKGLDRVLFFQSLDSVHCTHRYTYCLHHQKWHLQLVLANWLLVLVNWLLVLDEEVVLVQKSENLKRFQAHLEVLHRFHLNSWAETSWPSAVYLAALLQQFFFPFGVCGPCFRVSS